MTANPHDRVGREVIRHRRLILSLARLHAAIGHGQAQSAIITGATKLQAAEGNGQRGNPHLLPLCADLETLETLSPVPRPQSRPAAS